MIPNYASATILNNLVKAYNLTLKALPIAQSIENYCISFDDEELPLKLSYGLSKIESNKSELNKNCFNLGKGLVNITSNASYNELPNEIDNQFGFDLYDIFDSTDDLSNCYVLGALYLSINNTEIDYNFVIGRYSNDENSQIIISKDISLSDTEDILKYSSDIVFPSPTENEDESILIYKFIIDIEKYINDRKLDRFSIYFYDFRQPQGLFGFSDEEIYNNMIIGILNGNQQINYLANVELNNITEIILNWTNLDGWVENFVNYWSTSNDPLPEDLNIFIINELGIEI